MWKLKKITWGQKRKRQQGEVTVLSPKAEHHDFSSNGKGLLAVVFKLYWRNSDLYPLFTFVKQFSSYIDSFESIDSKKFNPQEYTNKTQRERERDLSML